MPGAADASSGAIENWLESLTNPASWRNITTGDNQMRGGSEQHMVKGSAKAVKGNHLISKASPSVRYDDAHQEEGHVLASIADVLTPTASTFTQQRRPIAWQDGI